MGRQLVRRAAFDRADLELATIAMRVAADSILPLGAQVSDRAASRSRSVVPVLQNDAPGRRSRHHQLCAYVATSALTDDRRVVAVDLVRCQLSIGAERVEPDASRRHGQTELPARRLDRDQWVCARRSSPWWRVADRRQCRVCDDGAVLWCPDHPRCGRARARAPRVRRGYAAGR